MALFKKIGNGIQSLWRFLCRNKIHIIPVLLWVNSFNVAINRQIIWYQTLAPLIACLFYYLLFLFPGFYAAWKKKYPCCSCTSGDKKQS